MVRSGAEGMMTSISCSIDGAIALLRGWGGQRGDGQKRYEEKWTQMKL